MLNRSQPTIGPNGIPALDILFRFLPRVQRERRFERPSPSHDVGFVKYGPAATATRHRNASVLGRCASFLIPAPRVVAFGGRDTPYRQRHTVEFDTGLTGVVKRDPQPVIAGAHRDVPLNIELTVDGEPELRDFARVRREIVNRLGLCSTASSSKDRQRGDPDLRIDRTFQWLNIPARTSVC